MKQHSHIQSLFLPWIEQTLDSRRRQLVDEHLEECVACRRYFDSMSVSLLPVTSSSSRTLSVDPFLPTRIRALAEEAKRRPIGVREQVVRWAFTTVMFVMAVVFGMYLGNRLAYRTSTITDQNIIKEYSESLEDGGIADRLQTIAQANTEVAK